MNLKISVIGGGSWGTALACLLAEKGYPVHLWVYEADLVATLNRTRENALYLPGIRLPERVTATSSLEEAAEGTGLILFVTPSHVARSVLAKLGPFIPSGTPIVIATKGIENESLMLMSQVTEDVLGVSPHPSLAILSGPSFAKEVCLHHPTAVVLAARDHALAARLQGILTTPTFKVFTGTDMIGTQLGGALKNVIALAAGGSDGLGFGHNTRAALIARGLTEIIRLGKAMGAEPKTFAGLSGLGDLILTCTGELSRNRTVGYQIGLGLKLEEILKQMKMVAEGVHTARAAHQLAQKQGVRMPIVKEVYSVLFEGKDPRQAVTDLMEGAAGDEVEA
jgi:glycerol-3-phosphate dehydrogenase (NAD(P)+)